MIISYRDDEAARLMRREASSVLPPDIQRTAYRKLLMIDAAIDLKDLRVPPGNRLEKLTGKRAGEYSIRINDQWRACFRWHEGSAHDVEIVDYH